MKPMSSIWSASSSTKIDTSSEAQVALIKMVNQPAGCRDEDVDAAREALGLRSVRHAAEDNSGTKAEMGAVIAKTLGDLTRKFARRREDERAAGARLRLLTGCGEPLQDRQREGGGLAGAGLRDAEDVAAFQNIGDGLRLDRRRRDIVFSGKRLEKRRVEVEV